MKLKNVKIHKYRCIETEQEFSVDSKSTILVGVNESGKTSVLNAIASACYFEKDADFEYDMTRDYPRAQLKESQTLEKPKKAVTLTFELADDISRNISDFLGYDSIVTNLTYLNY
jgi:predicted ATP-dependent endonuclease of OLD family